MNTSTIMPSKTTGPAPRQSGPHTNGHAEEARRQAVVAIADVRASRVAKEDRATQQHVESGE